MGNMSVLRIGNKSVLQRFLFWLDFILIMEIGMIRLQLRKNLNIGKYFKSKNLPL